ncbi:N-acetylglutamate synthase-like GNAT family acetyltransferase [Paraburkholderia youngii]|uniref:hypothetical protein n=1 Tax=Paraburkholderia youngii TaxID=2782701 RepID=UPI003D1A1CD2
MYLRQSTLVLEGESRCGLEIANVGVREQYRRQGVLSSAICIVEEAAARMGLGFVFVESILNPVLVPALERRGFTIVRHKSEAVVVGSITFPPRRDSADAYKLINNEPRRQSAQTNS